jgi:hypothetical protein
MKLVMNGIRENNAIPIPGAPVSIMVLPSLLLVSNCMDYPIWPEDDGTDLPRNPYSPQ